jgi:ribosomal-protein-alanine N-acetyltransferase
MKPGPDARGVAVVLGSSRGDGNTRRVVDLVFGAAAPALIDLSRLDISPYDYGHRNDGDDFRGVMDCLLSHPVWVLATPVYWYAMSGQMKVFLDRFSDLLTRRSGDGRRLRGTQVLVVASGTDPALPEGFEAPFRQTCDYLGMHYGGAFYLQFDGQRIVRPGAARAARTFADRLARIVAARGGAAGAAPARRRPPVRLETPTAARQREFLAAVGRSRRLHGRFASPPSTPALYRHWLSRLNGRTHVSYFVVDAASGQLAGVASLSEIVRGALQGAYLGYHGFEPHAGRGLMTEGLRQVIDLAFGELRLHRLEANIQPGNADSQALVARLGFVREGYSRRYLKINGRWRDHERWALLREDWKSRPRRT